MRRYCEQLARAIGCIWMVADRPDYCREPVCDDSRMLCTTHHAEAVKIVQEDLHAEADRAVSS